MIYSVPIVALVAGILLGVFMARKERWGALVAFVLAVIVVGGWSFIRARGAANGMDAIAIFIPVALLLAPVALGVLAGAAGVRIAALRRR